MIKSNDYRKINAKPSYLFTSKDLTSSSYLKYFTALSTFDSALNVITTIALLLTIFKKGTGCHIKGIVFRTFAIYVCVGGGLSPGIMLFFN